MRPSGQPPDHDCRGRTGRMTDYSVSMRFVAINPAGNGHFILLSLLTGRTTFAGFGSSRMARKIPLFVIGNDPPEYCKILRPNIQDSNAHNDIYFRLISAGTLLSMFGCCSNFRNKDSWRKNGERVNKL